MIHDWRALPYSATIEVGGAGHASRRYHCRLRCPRGVRGPLPPILGTTPIVTDKSNYPLGDSFRWRLYRWSWRLRGLVGKILLMAFGAFVGAYVIMAVANLRPLDDRVCEWKFPKAMSCLLGARENLAGGVIGAAGALMAAWLAWVAIQKQISTQQRANFIADLTFWQRKYDDAEIAMRGLEEVDDIARQCFKIWDTALADPNDSSPYTEALFDIERAGLLATQALPVTGANLIGFRMARLLQRLRHQRVLLEAEPSPGSEAAINSIRDDMQDLFKEIGPTVEKVDRERKHAAMALSSLQLSDHFPRAYG